MAHEPDLIISKRLCAPKYANPKKEEAGIITADFPDVLLSKYRADESLLAEIVTKKFADHLPLYRIEEIFLREGIKISRKLLSQWVLRVSDALKPLYDAMPKKILGSRNIFIDESPVKLWQKGKCRQVYMWVVVGGNKAIPPYRIYELSEISGTKNY